MRKLLLAIVGVAAVVLIVFLFLLPRHQATSTVVDSKRGSDVLTVKGEPTSRTTELPSLPNPATKSGSAYQPPGSNALASSATGSKAPSVTGFAATNSGPRQRPPEETDDVDEGEGKAPVFAASSDGIREAMSYIKYDIKECFEEWLKLGNPIAGKIKVQFKIARNEDGGAGTQEIKIADSTLQHTALEGCVGNAVTALRFEAPSETMTVNYPFVFSSDKSDADAR